MPRSIKDNISETATWIRLVYLVIYAAIFSLTGALVILVSVSQFLLKLFTGSVNARLKILGRDLGIYISDIVAFVTFHGAVTPYPFSPWPSPAAIPKTPAKKTLAKKTPANPKKTTTKSTTQKPRRRKPATQTPPANQPVAKQSTSST